MKTRTKIQLNPRQAHFVTSYLKHGNATRAALEAGYSKKASADAGHNLLRKSPAVKLAIAEARREVVKTAAYGLEQAMVECDEAIQFAIETENSNARVKAVELKSKLNGLLIEKHQHQVANFSLNIGGIDDEPKEVPSEVLAVTTSSTEEEEEDEDVFS